MPSGAGLLCRVEPSRGCSSPASPVLSVCLTLLIVGSAPHLVLLVGPSSCLGQASETPGRLTALLRSIGSSVCPCGHLPSSVRSISHPTCIEHLLCPRPRVRSNNELKGRLPQPLRRSQLRSSPSRLDSRNMEHHLMLASPCPPSWTLR